MKKNITFIFAITILALIGFAFTNDKQENSSVNTATNEGIQFFEGTWEEVLQKAKTEHKIIFLDAYAAWCGPCKIMTKKYFTKANVGTFYNEHFINFKMDMEKNPEGPRLSRKYKLTAYPTLYFVDGDENILHQSIGMLDDKALVKLGEDVLE
ncbi:thioredoxin [Putridiphycobacter roseus]|uniref:Thioredoxin n=1 Tax=Putridiphycobacter roseus TaxID=2219161 RepID=A0A2W1MZQ5_9FLAO|nr:DUF255 domain-containing protein [Putridiphycobacter roseus]PZE16884.1 thioredoxin [Putridiphycobacter roseus]